MTEKFPRFFQQHKHLYLPHDIIGLQFWIFVVRRGERSDWSFFFLLFRDRCVRSCLTGRGHACLFSRLIQICCFQLKHQTSYRLAIKSQHHSEMNTERSAGKRGQWDPMACNRMKQKIKIGTKIEISWGPFFCAGSWNCSDFLFLLLLSK